ncbi:MAG: hypothetical protein V1853_03040 [bacterium]
MFTALCLVGSVVAAFVVTVILGAILLWSIRESKSWTGPKPNVWKELFRQSPERLSNRNILVGLWVVLACIFAFASLSTKAQAAEVKNAARVDCEGEFTAWVYHERDGWNLNAIASTTGWAQIETGPTIKVSKVLIQPLLGVAAIGNPIEQVTFSPQLFAFYEDSNWDLGSWNISTFGKEAKPNFYYRDFLVARNLVRPIGIGLQMEGTFKSQENSHAYGLRLRYDLTDALPLSLFAARSFNDEWTYRLTLMKFF